MGEHDAPSSWLERWREAEPVRLYLWGIASAVIAASLVAGWLTAELAVAITGVAAAVLMLPAGVLIRRQAYSPLTVERLLDEQHALSYRQAEEDTLAETDQALTRARAEVRPHTAPARRLVAAETRELAAVQAEHGWPRGPVRPCPYMDEHGRRCVLPWHPATFSHRLEGEGAGE